PVRRWAARAMEAPSGRWLVAAAGLAVIASAVYQLYKAYALVFEEELRLARMSPGERRWARRFLRAGLTARGITFGIIGWFLLRAALDVDAREALDMAGALRLLARQDRGGLWLALVAVGLAAYGVLSLIDARYRRVT